MPDPRLVALAPLFLVLVAHEAGAVVAPGQQPERPATVSRQARVACDTARDIVRKTPGVSIQRSIGVLKDEALSEPVAGCRLEISGSFAQSETTGDAVGRLRQGFADRGWQEILRYAADGKDGTTFAFRRGPVACLVRGEWNGGADGEPEVPAEDWYRVSVLCTSPVPAEDSQPQGR